MESHKIPWFQTFPTSYINKHMGFINQLRSSWDASPWTLPRRWTQIQVAAGRTGTPGTKAPLRNLAVEVSEKNRGSGASQWESLGASSNDIIWLKIGLPSGCD